MSDVPTIPRNLPPPPRRVRLRPEARGRVWFPRVVTLPFAVVGVFLVFELLDGPVTRTLGAEGTGRVEEVRAWRRGGAPAGRQFRVRFGYDAGAGRLETAYGRIDTGGGPPPAVGEWVAIRTLTIGPLRRAELRDGYRDVPGLVCGGVWVAAWCGFVAALTLVSWVGPALDRRLVRDGEVVVGRVTAAREADGRRGAVHQVVYQFRSRRSRRCRATR